MNRTDKEKELNEKGYISSVIPVTREMVEDDIYGASLITMDRLIRNKITDGPMYPDKVIAVENCDMGTIYPSTINKMITLKTRPDVNVYLNLSYNESGNVTLNKVIENSLVSAYCPAQATHLNVLSPENSIILSVLEVTKLYNEMKLELKRLKVEKNKADRNAKREDIKRHTNALNYNKNQLKKLKNG